MRRTGRCRHDRGAELCRWCGRRTCADCHHAPAHLDACPDTRRTETRSR